MNNKIRIEEVIEFTKARKLIILAALISFVIGLLVADISLAMDDHSVSGMIRPIEGKKPLESVFECPEGGLVDHPCREPDQLLTFKISRYDPSLGGTNCFKWDYLNETCESPTASGERWEHGFERFAACPSSFPFGTIVEIGSKRWICKDRGSAIVRNPDGSYWIDLLSKDLWNYELQFAQLVQGSVWFPTAE